MVDLEHRSRALEIMDDLTCAGPVVGQTLKELEVINRLLGGNKVTLNGIRLLLKKRPNDSKLVIADLGCGGGDILKLLARWGQRKKIPLQLVGLDANPNIVSFAKKNSLGFSEIRYETINIMSEEFKQTQFDIVMATLFTHHFSEDELVEIFRSLKLQVRRGIVINDIHRHWIAFYAIFLLTRLFSKSTMVKFDAPLSVLRAFRKNEWEAILRKAGIENYRLRWKWAFRWQLIIPAIGPASMPRETK